MTTFRSDRHIRNTCLQNRKMCVAHITGIINQAGINVSQRTIQRRLAEENLIARRAVRKPRLTKAMKTSVYNGPENTVEDWNKVNMINDYDKSD